MIVTLLLFTAVLFALGVVVGIAVTQMDLKKFEWASFLTGFGAVLLAGWVSLIVADWARRCFPKSVTEVLLATICRIATLGMVIITVIVTQSKSFVFYTLCFSIVFYLGLLPVNVWLMSPRKKDGPDNMGDLVHHEH